MATAPELTRKQGGVIVDTEKMLRFMDAKIAATHNERHKRNLQSVRDHMYYEKLLDPDSVMKTLSPKANYKLWVDGVDKGPKGFRPYANGMSIRISAVSVPSSSNTTLSGLWSMTMSS